MTTIVVHANVEVEGLDVGHLATIDAATAAGLISAGHLTQIQAAAYAAGTTYQPGQVAEGSDGKFYQARVLTVGDDPTADTHAAWQGIPPSGVTPIDPAQVPVSLANLQQALAGLGVTLGGGGGGGDEWITLAIQTAAVEAAAGQKIPVDTTAGGFPVTLPAAVVASGATPTQVMVVNVAAEGAVMNVATLVPVGQDTINLAPTELPLIVLPGESVELQCLETGRWDVV